MNIICYSDAVIWFASRLSRGHVFTLIKPFFKRQPEEINMTNARYYHSLRVGESLGKQLTEDATAGRITVAQMRQYDAKKSYMANFDTIADIKIKRQPDARRVVTRRSGTAGKT